MMINIFLNLLFYWPLLSPRESASVVPIKLPQDSILLSWMAEYKVPALGIGIIEDGKTGITKVLGDLKSGRPAPSNTIFQVASLTKPIVEMTVLRLVSSGQWALDEPLYHYWVDPDVQGDTLYKKLTTRHVLVHQTGFVNWRWLHPTGKLCFDFPPGTQTRYSGEGLEYLKKSLEKKFSKPLEEIVDSALFIPEGMKNTRFYWDDRVDESKFAVAHNKEGQPYEIRKYTTASAADLLMTTVEDYTRFGASVLSQKNLSPEIWKEMIRLQAPAQKSKFGLGWEVYQGLGQDEYALLHTGSDPGVRTIIILLPASKRGLILFTNGDNGMQVILKIIRQSLDVGDQLIKMGG